MFCCVCRWLSEEGHKVGAFMPFASGQRMCLGYNFAMLEIKVSAEFELMHKTIQSFTSCKVAKQPGWGVGPAQDMRVVYRAIE